MHRRTFHVASPMVAKPCTEQGWGSASQTWGLAEEGPGGAPPTLCAASGVLAPTRALPHLELQPHLTNPPFFPQASAGFGLPLP